MLSYPNFLICEAARPDASSRSFLFPSLQTITSQIGFDSNAISLAIYISFLCLKVESNHFTSPLKVTRATFANVKPGVSVQAQTLQSGGTKSFWHVLLNIKSSGNYEGHKITITAIYGFTHVEATQVISSMTF